VFRVPTEGLRARSIYAMSITLGDKFYSISILVFQAGEKTGNWKRFESGSRKK
jgi:hypothetical protein